MTEDGPCVLVVDDDPNISYLVSSALRLEGYRTLTADDGRQALQQVAEGQPDLVVLDVMMPELDGFDVLKRLRQDGFDQPVIFLTARDGGDDRVRGLQAGGDDYVVKPFLIEELVARVAAVLRRSGVGMQSAVLSYADLAMDEDAHRVTRGGHVVKLSPTEYKLLRYLLLNAERVLSRAQILDHVWGYDFDGESTVVETFVSYLRRKVDAAGPPLIQTVRGVGYCLRLEDESP
ncbi:MAG: response regulator transcription factor [Acidimicrobiales bacterium]